MHWLSARRRKVPGYLRFLTSSSKRLLVGLRTFPLQFRRARRGTNTQIYQREPQ
jgi:hypothetical protein